MKSKLKLLFSCAQVCSDDYRVYGVLICFWFEIEPSGKSFTIKVRTDKLNGPKKYTFILPYAIVEQDKVIFEVFKYMQVLIEKDLDYIFKLEGQIISEPELIDYVNKNWSTILDEKNLISPFTIREVDRYTFEFTDPSI